MSNNETSRLIFCSSFCSSSACISHFLSFEVVFATLRYFLTLKLLTSSIGNRFLGCHATNFFSTLCDRYDVLSHLFAWSNERTYVLFAQPLPISLDRVIK